jgi:hypothetical protein
MKKSLERPEELSGRSSDFTSVSRYFSQAGIPVLSFLADTTGPLGVLSVV